MSNFDLLLALISDPWLGLITLSLIGIVLGRPG